MNDSFWERHRFTFYTLGMVVCGLLVADVLMKKLSL
ncbi:hypothetical protein EAT1b_2160 [Exiguobacterium sp. AT1b]|uniref:Uncharacterized protein n=1 Tax=Exiguobacterium sp. (strain ATCC BAA-1283 / AT1b) TaxID=360911 RepID=C4L1Q1_EXISA|nr:hypothetical protein EAT1b_2160 [Exiguobacterium sp. AT1b]